MIKINKDIWHNTKTKYKNIYIAAKINTITYLVTKMISISFMLSFYFKWIHIGVYMLRESPMTKCAHETPTGLLN